MRIEKGKIDSLSKLSVDIKRLSVNSKIIKKAYGSFTKDPSRHNRGDPGNGSHGGAAQNGSIPHGQGGTTNGTTFSEKYKTGQTDSEQVSIPIENGGSGTVSPIARPPNGSQHGKKKEVDKASNGNFTSVLSNDLYNNYS